MNVLAPQPSVSERQAGTGWAAHSLMVCGVSQDTLVQGGFQRWVSAAGLGQGEADAD